MFETHIIQKDKKQEGYALITISLCMIVKNEEDVLARCLDCMKDIADEMIIVDTGSTDSTREIAARYTDKVYELPWNDDFAGARNFSFSKAAMDYCMWLDADDVITEENREKFKQLKQTLDPETDVVMMKYVTAFDEKNNPLFSYYRERLVKNHKGFVWIGRVHEAIAPAGQILYLDTAIEHRKLHPSESDRNLRIYERMLAEGQELEPRHQFYYGRELYYHQRYDDAVLTLEKFLEEDQGWIENKIEACMNLSHCYESMGKRQDMKASLFKSFIFDKPRAEICCEIGRHLIEENIWHLAAYWYETALMAEKKEESGGFVLEDCYGYLPNLQLCVCYDRMGNLEKSYEFHKKTALLKPESKAVEQNKLYFSQKFPE